MDTFKITSIRNLIVIVGIIVSLCIVSIPNKSVIAADLYYYGSTVSETWVGSWQIEIDRSSVCIGNDKLIAAGADFASGNNTLQIWGTPFNDISNYWPSGTLYAGIPNSFDWGYGKEWGHEGVDIAGILAQSPGHISNVRSICYGVGPVTPTPTPTLTPTPTATPDPELSCHVEGQNVTVDLVTNGSVNGSLSAIPYNYDTPGDLIDVINFSVSSVVPLTYGEVGQDLQGTIQLEMDGANILYVDSWINDTFVPNTPTDLNYIPVEGGQTTQTVTYVGYVHRSLPDMRTGDTPRITAIKLSYTAANDGKQLICDGGMTKSTFDTPWQRTNNEEFGRGWMDWFGIWNGYPACDPGQQSIAHQGYTGVGSVGNYTPVKQAFMVPIGASAINFKFRYRSRPEASWLGLYSGSPNVYITNEAGEVVADLFGTVNFDQGLVVTNWTMITGTQSLSPGKYYLVLNQGYKWSGGNINLETSGQLYYDDVQVSTGDVDTGCSDWVYIPPEVLPTATPSPSPTPTMTGTVPTETPTLPLMGTPSATSTLRNTPTMRATPSTTVTRTPGPSNTPNSTVTQYWISTTVVPSTATPVTSTPVTQPGWNPGLEPGPPSDDFGNYPGTNPGTGEINCNRPTSILAFAWWLDYERCLIMAGISWGPNQSATLVAIPVMMTTKEPFNTVRQISQGLNSMGTQAAVYNWSNTGMSGVNPNITPDPRFIFSQNLASPGSGNTAPSPWDRNGQIPLTLNTSAASSSTFSVVCNTKLSNMMAARLGEGLCFVLNVTRSMGYLGWVQFFANSAIIFGMVRLILGSIRYYSFFPSSSAGPYSEADKKEILKNE